MCSCHGLFEKIGGTVIPRISQNNVHPWYWYKSLQEIYENSIFPVVQDQMQFDGITKPPVVQERQAEHPKTKRIRNRIRFLDPGDSPIICSLCGKTGHNKRTCPSAEGPFDREQPRTKSRERTVTGFRKVIW